MTPLVAILGAGASRGSGDYTVPGVPKMLRSPVPPLTVDLFDEKEYSSVLRQYDLAHQAGRLITEQIAQNDALGLEHALHGLDISEFQHHKHMAIAVPLYLQHLLHEVSDSRYTEALHYDRLIERLLRLPYVFFVSLNYDVLLDRRLNGHCPLSNLDAYTENGQNWSLIKPHGSVNWCHHATSHYIPATPPLDLRWNRQTFRCIPPTASLGFIRGSDASESNVTPESASGSPTKPRSHRRSRRDLNCLLRRAQRLGPSVRLVCHAGVYL
jgi:hypothetical protein